MKKSLEMMLLLSGVLSTLFGAAKPKSKEIKPRKVTESIEESVKKPKVNINFNYEIEKPELMNYSTKRTNYDGEKESRKSLNFSSSLKF